MRRYREIHDLTHLTLGMPINMLGEVTVKWFEGIQYGLPMCVLGAFFGPLRLGPKHTAKYLYLTLPWVVRTARQSRLLMNVYFEKHWHKPLTEFRRELNILEPPPKI
jgi:ubiquinone biosynthesis protein COQ4